MPDYISTADAAAKWGITTRRVAILCAGDRVPGAKKIGNTWIIPGAAEKPPDARIRSGKYVGFREELKANRDNKTGGEQK